eukprot:TRINITY_DN6748_c0_g2_i1.p1 TRINITY_DN6748_c0_g2~~TRINITY_DN6748_c0_g2_i1.p1  ORF type:complete len:164 (+),score=65.32 TRINITY_DN6748_c0_g2_i1:252-743(+)
MNVTVERKGNNDANEEEVGEQVMKQKVGDKRPVERVQEDGEGEEGTKKRRIKERVDDGGDDDGGVDDDGGGDMEDVLKQVVEGIPGRKKQLEEMLRVMGTPMEHCGALFVFGHGGTGKTRVVKAVLRYVQQMDKNWEKNVDYECKNKDGGRKKCVSYVNCVQM